MLPKLAARVLNPPWMRAVLFLLSALTTGPVVANCNRNGQLRKLHDVISDIRYSRPRSAGDMTWQGREAAPARWPPALPHSDRPSMLVLGHLIHPSAR